MNRCDPREPTATAIHGATDKVAKQLSSDIADVRKDCSSEIAKAQQDSFRQVRRFVSAELKRIENQTTWFIAGQMSLNSRAPSNQQTKEAKKLLEKLVKSAAPTAAPPAPTPPPKCDNGTYYSFVRGACIREKKARKLPSIRSLQMQQQQKAE